MLNISSRFLMANLGLAMLCVVGCGTKGPQTYPVRGKVELVGGDVSVLAGSHVEAALTSDPTIRASGTIQSDGSFALETIHAGDLLIGAREGRYAVRLVLSDDDREVRRRAAKSVAKRYLDFNASGLTFDVPASKELVLSVTPR